ncbi:S-layer homology domain-containing protein [uncultured Ezakiella sp.]|uniref:S-layer homology domain-containing protein n=1 Tax=uncultured Ezakiella sp. TaxID=1637529 RepID=UPI0025E79CF4|nr:S-layer homology domain-containing protein [uncultured Ezakiella sp.]
MRRKILITILIISMLSLSILAYSDVKDNWAKTYIDWASDRGLFTGYKDGTFKPKGHITNAEFVAVMGRLIVEDIDVELKFTDIPDNSWYESDLKKLVGLGLIENSGAFEPNEKIIRAEAFRILAGIYKRTSNEKTEYHFKDAVVVNNQAGIAALIHDGIITGDAENNLKPLDPISREEMCAILKKCFDKYGY